MDQISRRGSRLTFQLDQKAMQEAVSMLVYGCQINVQIRTSPPLLAWFHICQSDNRIIRMIDVQSQSYLVLDLTEIFSIDNQPYMEHFKLLIKDRSNNYITLMFNSEQERTLIHHGLSYLMDSAIEEQRKLDKLNALQSQAMKIFVKVDQNLDYQMDFSEFQRLLGKMRIHLTEKRLVHIFSKYKKKGLLQEKDIFLIIQEFTLKDELIPVFKQYTHNRTPIFGEALMKEAELAEFFLKEQGEYITHEQFNELMLIMLNQYRVDNDEYGISQQCFGNMLFSIENSIFDPKLSRQYQVQNSNMKSELHPLSDYYVSSSHNTYLLTNQLTGESSLQAYIDAFELGFKCVEVDCWDGKDGEPIVTHGHTLTSVLSFEDVIKVVNQYGFIVSPYPVILSLEVHCSFEQQARMVQIIKNVLKDKLYVIREGEIERPVYPCLAELRQRVIIKNKGYFIEQDDLQEMQVSDIVENFRHLQQAQGRSQRKKSEIILQEAIIEEQEQESEQEKNSSQASSSQSTTPPNNNNLSISKRFTLPPDRRVSLFPPKNEYSVTLGDRRLSAQVTRTRTSFISRSKFQPNYDLQNITALYGTKLSLENGFPYVWCIASLDETKILGLSQSQPELLKKFLKNFFLRVYPTGARIGSSNFDPIPSWLVGAQIVALNAQTKDLPLLLNQAKFSDNGLSILQFQQRGGYVLKPSYMLSTCKDPKPNQPLKLTLTVISGQHLTWEDHRDESVNPYVKVRLKGAPEDEKSAKKWRTSTADFSSHYPNFKNYQAVIQIQRPEHAIIYFQVFSYSLLGDTLMGQYALPALCIRQGYRVVPLMNSYLQTIDASYIFVHVKIQNL